MELGGHVELRPGRRPAIRSTRAELAPRLLNGLPPAEAPRRVAAWPVVAQAQQVFTHGRRLATPGVAP
ncbi:hypothetical protein CLD22_13890, partial [Rubrivivax gelatinosus]|nr:hypothetical protein [Rubrivivax gelatinosus]